MTGRPWVVALVAVALPLPGLGSLAAQRGSGPVAAVVVTPAQPRLAVGDTMLITARAVDAAGQSVPDVQLVFQTVGPTTADVRADGLVRAGAIGTTALLVTAVAPGSRPVIQRVPVLVVAGPAARIEIAPHPAVLVPGQEVRLEATVLSAQGDARGDTVSWASSAPGIARIGPDGRLEARSGGSATLTATAGSVQASTTVTVTSAAPAVLAIEPVTAAARQGDVVRFGLVAKDRGGRPIPGVTPAWSFSPGQGQIGPDGGFVAYAPGVYTITASLAGRSASATVRVALREVRRPATVLGKVVRKAFPTSEVWLHPNGQVAYLGTHGGGDRFYTIDIRDPGNPLIVDSVVANTRLINDIMTDKDGRLLVFTRENATDRRNGIVICTLDDPFHPKVVAEFTEGVTAGVHSAFVYTQAKHGTHVYLTNDGTGALHIIDLNDPAHPKEVGRWATARPDASRSLHDVDVQDGLLYASWWDDGLVILDIGSGVRGGSPSNPQLVAQYKYDLDSLYRQVAETNGPGFIRGTHTAWRHKNYVFLADEVFAVTNTQTLTSGALSRAYGRLHVLDVSDLAHPRPVAWYEPEYGGVHNVWVAGDTLYMGAYNAGFRAFDIAGELRGDLAAQGREIVQVNPVDPEGYIPNVPMTWGVVVKNDLAYVNDFFNGLFVVRLEPREPRRPLVP